MIKPYHTQNETISQLIVEMENQPVIVDICYSGDIETLEFEYSEVSEENKFDDVKKQELNDILECGLEETIVQYLANYYANTSITFDPNHYQLTK